MVERTNKNRTEVNVGDCVNVADPAEETQKILLCGSWYEWRHTKLVLKVESLKVGFWGTVLVEGLSVSEAPTMKLSIRALVHKLSIGDEQGFKICSCKMSMLWKLISLQFLASSEQISDSR